MGTTTRSKTTGLLGLLVLLGGAVLPGAGQEPGLDKKQVDALVEEYVALDGRDDAGRVQRLDILRELDALPALEPREARAWRKRIAKLWAKGPKLETKSGRHFLWEDEERGLYIVGGKSRRPKGLFIGLHGGGAGSGDAWSAQGSFSSVVSREKWVGIFPEVLEKVDRGWTESGTEEFVLELVERALRTWKIDRDRVFFGGHSMGGFGTWTLGAHHADLVAGLTPSAGAPTPVLEGGRVVDIDYGVIPNLRNVRLVVYQSDDDPRVPPGPNRKAAELLEAAREEHGGYDFEYWEESGRGHDPPPGGMKALIARVHDAVRDPRPDKVVWQPTLRWKHHFYWLWWDRPSVNAIVVAELVPERNEIRVESTGVGGGLYALLDGEMLDLEREVVVVFNGEEVFRGVVERSLAALVSTGVRGDPALTFDARILLSR